MDQAELFETLLPTNLCRLYSKLTKFTYTSNDMSGAEVILGVVAGGAGLASLSIQLAESALKLKRLYHSIRNAPETLTEIADEIHLMSLSLQHLERHRQNENHGADLLNRCIENCRSHTTKITLLTEKISQKIDNASLTGRLYASMRERDLDKLLGDLARARSALHLAVELYHRAEEERRWRMQEADTAKRQDQMAMCLVALQALQANHAAMMRQNEPLVQYPRVQEVQDIYANLGEEPTAMGLKFTMDKTMDRQPTVAEKLATRLLFASG